MSVTTRYLVIGETGIEFVTRISGDSTSISVNVLPPEPKLEQPEPIAKVEPEALLCAAPPVTKKQRTFKGLIRAMWTAVFSFGGEALVYGLNNLTALNLPPGVGLAIGAVGYGAKAAIFPSTRL
jgi:hypothetical protein